jgi:simple sugar transport system permease protein
LIEFLIFFIYLLDIIFIEDDPFIEERRLMLFLIPVILALAYRGFNKMIINFYEDGELSSISLVVPSVIGMLNFITLQNSVLGDFIFSLILAIVLIAIHKIVTLYIKIEILMSYVFVLLALGVLFPKSFYITDFQEPMWDMLKAGPPGTLTQILTFSLPLALVAVGASFNERAGVINIGLEGILIFATFTAIYFTTHNPSNTISDPYMGLIAAIIVGGLVGLVHGIMTITFKGEQIVTGVAINLLAVGMTGLLTALIWQPGKSEIVKGDHQFEDVDLFELEIFGLRYGRLFDFLSFENFLSIDLTGLPLVGSFFEEIPDLVYVFQRQTPALYIGIMVLPLCHILLFKTPIGLRIRAIGENPEAAATAGINVHKYQYFAVILSGMLTGLAGGIIAFEVALFTEKMTSGLGFYALAIMIFGKWTVLGSVGAAFLFGFFKVSSRNISTIPALASNTPGDIINLIPNLIAILALAGFIGRAIPPKAIGKAYDPGGGE